MQTRMLYEADVPQAAGVARGIFDNCVRNSIQDPQMSRLTEEYLTVSNLITMMRARQLFLWGTFENGQLVGVGGMQQEGHITMLYVFPYYQRLGIGRALVKEMRSYAAANLQKPRVTLNAMPPIAAGYFRKIGFTPIDMSQNNNSSFVSMASKIEECMTYPVKKLGDKAAIGISFGFLAVIFIVAIGFMFTQMQRY